MKTLEAAVVAAVLAVGCGGENEAALSVAMGEPSVAPAASGAEACRLSLLSFLRRGTAPSPTSKEGSGTCGG